MANQTEPRPVEVVTACMRPDGLPTFVLNRAEVSQDEAENGVHYDLAAAQLLEAGYEERRAALLSALASGDLAALPANDLAASQHAEELLRLGAVRADVSGAGPTVYGLIADEQTARAAAAQVERRGRVWVVPQAW